MDIINDKDNQTDTKHTGHHKGKSIKVKKVEGKKPSPGGGILDKAPETRSRAKSTLVNPFDTKKPMNSKKESKPVETIGNDRFNLLKSMFEKKGPSATAEVIPRKYEPKNFSVFQQKENNQIAEEKKSDTVTVQPTGISEGIKKRMQDLMNSNKRSSFQAKMDPILEQRKKEREIEEDGDDDEDQEDQEDLGISEEEDNLDKNDEFSESEEEKEKEDAKIIENNKQTVDSRLCKDDSFEEHKEDVKDEIEVDIMKERNLTEDKSEIKTDYKQHPLIQDIIEEKREEIEQTNLDNKSVDIENTHQQEIPRDEVLNVVADEQSEELDNNQQQSQNESNEHF